MMEVIIVDGGSTDGTKEIVSRYNVKVMHNPRRVEDGPNGGKSIGARHARGDIICFLDSDNIIWGETWLKTMVQPLVENSHIAMCESSRHLDKNDPAINRFCSYYVLETESRDPFIPFYRLSDRVVENRRPCYYTYRATNDPPCLANGSTIRRKVLKLVGGYDYDSEVVHRLIAKNYTLFAQSTCGGIHHLYVLSIGEFLMKAINRARNFLSRRNWTMHSRPFSGNGLVGLLFAVAEGLIPIRKLSFALRKVHTTHDMAWLYYPLTSALATTVYLLLFIISDKQALLRDALH